MQEQLLDWCLNSQWPYDKVIHKTEPRVLWLHGPAGAGKSAIMRTLSERLDAEGRLGGTFFFKRGHATRGNPKVLFSTIALQLAVNCPQLKLRIAPTVENNPTLVGRSIGVQLQELILKPCIGFEGPSQTIIIDGLDECEGHNVQQEVIRVILHSARQQSSLRFIMASRPEAHICETLAEPSYYGLYRDFDVEGCFEDVQKYFVAEFARIHREHKSMTNIPRPWPPNEAIEHLVVKSSGYFIYASTVIKFVDDKNFRPTRRLEALENLVGIGGDSPFGALDTLYTQILSTIPKGHPLVPILRVIDHVPGLALSSIDILLRLERGDTELCLRGLHSVVEVDGEAPQSFHGGATQFFHASFSDFLHDPSRAGDFYTEDLAGIYELIESSFTALCYEYEDETNNRNNPLAFTRCLQTALNSIVWQFEPSQRLVQLLSGVNYDFIEEESTSILDGVGLLSWLETAHPLPENLTRRWQCHASILLGESLQSDKDFPVSTWRQVSTLVMEHAARSPLLLYICCGMLWTTDLTC
ncbi:hypothetical protein C8R47DRAFT_150814 [Mycena vitilis]|nr:hypothetical protein C8R47DRAFT_150814 [Mycena vitilis]